MFFGSLLPNTTFQGTPYSKLRLLSVAPELRRWVHSFPFAYHLRMRNLLPIFSPAYASAMRRGFFRLRGFCALLPVAQAAVFRPAAVSPAPTFSWCGVSCALFNPRPTRRSSGPALKAAQPA